MDTNAILGPVATLALWSMVMWVWMYATRIPAMNRAKIDAKNLVGTTGRGLDEVLPPEVQWKAHNYNHLMEQPTVFYAVALALAVGCMGGGLNADLAWAYVGLRIVHSIVQATVNRGELPGRQVADAMLIGVGAALMIVPGYFSTLIGLLLVLPPLRGLIYGALARRFRVVGQPAPASDPHLIDLGSGDWRER